MEKFRERRCCCLKSSFHHKTQVQAEGWKLLQQNFRTFSNSIYLFTWLFVEQYYWCFRLLWLGENDKYIPEECHVINLYCHITKENVFIGPKIIVDCRHSGNLEKELKLHHHQNGSWNGRMNHRRGWVGKDLTAHPAPTSCCGLVTPHQIRLPRAASTLALGTSRDGTLWAAVPTPHQQWKISHWHLI